MHPYRIAGFLLIMLLGVNLPAAADAPSDFEERPLHEITLGETVTYRTLRNSYRRIISRQIRTHIKRMPEAKSLAGSVAIRFHIDNGGTLLFSTVDTSSGSELLDRVALNAVRNAAPFPVVLPEHKLCQELECPDYHEFTIPITFKPKRMASNTP